MEILLIYLCGFVELSTSFIKSIKSIIILLGISVKDVFRSNLVC